MKKYLKFLIFTLCLSGGFFGTGILDKALAANSCTATINFNPKYGVGGLPGVVTLSGEVTLQNLAVGTGGKYYCFPSAYSYTGYLAINIGFNKNGNIPDGVAKSIRIDLSNVTSSQKTFKFSTDIDATATGASAGQTAFLQACVFPTSASDGDQSPLICSAVTPVIIGTVKSVPSGDVYGCVVSDRIVCSTKSGDSKCNDSSVSSCGGNCQKINDSACCNSLAIGVTTIPSTYSCGGTKAPPAPGAGATPGASPGGMQAQPAQVLYNPITNVPDLTSLLIKIMRGFVLIAGIWAVAFIVIGGFKMVISQGNEEAVTAARKSITWSVIGLIVVLLAFSIIAIIQNLVGVDIKEVKTSQIPSYNITQKI